jgi:hypothetical protein
MTTLLRTHGDDDVSLSRHSQFALINVPCETGNGIADQRFHLQSADFAGKRHGSEETANECCGVNCADWQAGPLCRKHPKSSSRDRNRNLASALDGKRPSHGPGKRRMPAVLKHSR